MIDIRTHNFSGDRFRLMVFNATFNNFHLYPGGQIYWWSKLEYPEKPTYLSLTSFIT